MTNLLDLNHLLLYVGDDRLLRDEILTIYHEQLAKWSERLSPDMDDDAWYQANHTLKGASRGVGVWSIGDLCEHAETLVNCGACEKRKQVVSDIKTKADAVLAHIVQLLKADAA